MKLRPEGVVDAQVEIPVLQKNVICGVTEQGS